MRGLKLEKANQVLGFFLFCGVFVCLWGGLLTWFSLVFLITVTPLTPNLKVAVRYKSLEGA